MDSVSCLDSESVGIDSKMVLDSESALHSALGLSPWRGVDSAMPILHTKKLVIAVGLVEFLAGLGVGAT